MTKEELKNALSARKASKSLMSFMKSLKQKKRNLIRKLVEKFEHSGFLQDSFSVSW